MGLRSLEEEEDTPDLLLSALGGPEQASKGCSPEHDHAGTLIINFQPPEL